MKDISAIHNTGSTRNCGNCAFALNVRLSPPHIGSQLECHFNPPVMFLAPSPTGAVLQTMFPCVNERMLCNQHHLKDEISNIPPPAN